MSPPQYEIEEYILEVVKKHDLDKHARFGTAVHMMKWNDDDGLWSILAADVKSGQRYEHKTKIILSCQGALVHPVHLSVPGLDDKFQGEYMHSALWNHDVDFKGKNVLVVGNGCSAIQVIPALLNELEVKSVTQVFRSKHWILPPHPQWAHKVYNALSGTRVGLIMVRWFATLVAGSRYPLYHGDGYLSRLLRWHLTRESTNYVKLAPQKYHDLLLPDYKLGCKRLIYDSNYIPSLRNPKFDLKGWPIKEIRERDVILHDGSVVEAEIIVACTGYNIHTAYTQSYTTIGRNGLNIQEMWDDEGASAYKTAMVRDCPNFFFITGPNSATGHFSVVSAIENVCAFVSRVAQPVVNGTIKSVSVKRSAYYEWFQTTQDRLKNSVFDSLFGGCVTWYSGWGKFNSVFYPYSHVHYWFTSRFFLRKDFDYEPYSELKKDV